jgi:hypothetical protein
LWVLEVRTERTAAIAFFPLLLLRAGAVALRTRSLLPEAMGALVAARGTAVGALREVQIMPLTETTAAGAAAERALRGAASTEERHKRRLFQGLLLVIPAAAAAGTFLVVGLEAPERGTGDQLRALRRLQE